MTQDTSTPTVTQALIAARAEIVRLRHGIDTDEWLDEGLAAAAGRPLNVLRAAAGGEETSFTPPAPMADVLQQIDAALRTKEAPADVSGLVERLQSHMGRQDRGILLADCREAATLITHLSAEIAEARKVIEPDERLDHITSALIVMVEGIENEGDRAYFGSTNDADQLQEIADELDEMRRTAQQEGKS